MEEFDADLIQTAIRESEEEIGLHKGQKDLDVGQDVVARGDTILLKIHIQKSHFMK